jgi:hypothetical protein
MLGKQFVILCVGQTKMNFNLSVELFTVLNVFGKPLESNSQTNIYLTAQNPILKSFLCFSCFICVAVWKNINITD